MRLGTIPRKNKLARIGYTLAIRDMPSSIEPWEVCFSAFKVETRGQLIGSGSCLRRNGRMRLYLIQRLGMHE